MYSHTKLARNLSDNLNENNIKSYAAYVWKVLHKTGGLSRLDNLMEMTRKYICLKQNITPITVISARKLSPREKGMISDTLEKKFNGKISIYYEIEPSTLGGIIIKTQDSIMDYSWKGKLTKLKSNLETL